MKHRVLFTILFLVLSACGNDLVTESLPSNSSDSPPVFGNVDRRVITDGGLREPAAGQTAARVEGPQARIPPCGV